MNKSDNLIGVEFGMLTVVSRCKNAANVIYWECICSCGGKIKARTTRLKDGTNFHCGCKTVYRGNPKKERSSIKMRIPEYKAWTAMRGRCFNKKHFQYEDYGGRGISVCSRWGIFDN